MNPPTDHFTTQALTQRLATAALRAAPRRAWLALLIVGAIALTLAAAGLFARYVQQQLRAAPPITIIATPTPGSPRAAVVPTPAAIMQLIGYFDYRDASTATPIDPARLACVVGQADGERWRLIALDNCASDTRLWIYAELVPAKVPAADLSDLTPRTAVPAPALAEQPGYSVSRVQQIEQAPEPVATPLPPIYNLRAARGFPGPGEPGFVESFEEPGCSPLVGYLPDDPCYRSEP